MKKTLIALAVTALVSTTANSTVIYQQDGTKIDLDGRASFELRNDSNNRTDLRDVGSRVRFRAYQDLGYDFTALGAIELRFSNDNGAASSIGGNLRTHRLFAGFTNKNIGTLTFGRQLHLGDHIPKANYTYEWGGNILFDAHKKAAHFMSVPFGGVRVAADYYFGNSIKNNNASSGSSGWDEGQGYGVGLFYDGKWNDLAVRFGSGYSEVTQSADGTKTTQYDLKRGGVGFDLRYKIVTVGFDWAFGKATKGYDSSNLVFQKIAGYNTSLNKINRFLLGAKVNVTEKNAVYTQYYFAEGKKADSSIEKYKMRGWMIGADHRFNRHVAVYVEGGQGKVKQGGETMNVNGKTNHRVLIGTRILF
ncbi:putative porin [Volucribacter psittacicida]|uniref:Putative porin n=1 Tax=Volucribacter psittacicida TaxID=203482 RepID=A0A4V2PCM9_9PAST|nr:porin [Volucribacter psittacicida]TCK01896.1 putative porin [Volucribacter psittacicida]